MSTLVVNRSGAPLLGKEERAEELVIWSEKNKPGKRWIKDFPFGLRLGFVAAGTEPKMYIHWNQQKMYRFLDDIGGSERFVTTNYGICSEYYLGITRICVLGAGKTGVILWDSLENPFSRQHSFRDPEDEVNWLIGMIRFSEEGPLLIRQAECQQELEEATALAVFHKASSRPKRKTNTVGKILPKQTLLSHKTKQFLLQDAAINLLLQAQNVKSV